MILLCEHPLVGRPFKPGFGLSGVGPSLARPHPPKYWHISMVPSVRARSVGANLGCE
jgi:hypothetical protein